MLMMQCTSCKHSLLAVNLTSKLRSSRSFAQIYHIHSSYVTLSSLTTHSHYDVIQRACHSSPIHLTTGRKTKRDQNPRFFSLSFSTSNPTPTKNENNRQTDGQSNLTPINPSILPGIGLSAVTATAGFQLASLISSHLSIPISGIPTSILLGMTINNSLEYDSKTFKPGITFSTKTILQCGIVAVAAKLSFFELLNSGSSGFPVVLAAVGSGMLYIPFAGRAAGLPVDMSLLLTAGTSICGVTAITALAPAINASNRSVAVAIANTVAFGTVGMLTYPYLFHTICASSDQVGVCLGVAIHDTSQVLGSAMSYRDVYGDEMALKMAAVTKLTRNLGLIGAIPGLSYVHHSSTNGPTKTENANYVEAKNETVSGLMSFQKFVPSFLVAFLGMSTLRSVGDFYLADANISVFNNVMNLIGNDVSKYALGTAMAGVGLSTSTSSLKGVGWRPFAVGGTGALVVGGSGYFTASMLL